eukprot:gb/GECG01015165.1/.p1 GENE.gb/GECG01015165.1/~~gb/GECG01015165.1/.p1  ORF type:complete len:115 (+),score=12.34 gb/GECG01015165.1/:1-345(+)
MDSGTGVARGRGSGSLNFAGFGSAENFIRSRLALDQRQSNDESTLLQLLARKVQSPYIPSINSDGVIRGPTPPGDMRAEALWQQHCAWRVLQDSTSDLVSWNSLGCANVSNQLF